MITFRDIENKVRQTAAQVRNTNGREYVINQTNFKEEIKNLKLRFTDEQLNYLHKPSAYSIIAIAILRAWEARSADRDRITVQGITVDDIERALLDIRGWPEQLKPINPFQKIIQGMQGKNSRGVEG